jgi:hypothetical protein
LSCGTATSGFGGSNGRGPFVDGSANLADAGDLSDGDRGTPDPGVLVDSSERQRADGASARCSPIGSTRTCCGGTQTCGGTEFGIWGPCLDSTAAIATCTFDAGAIYPSCGMTSEGTPTACDGGTDRGPSPPPSLPAICNDASAVPFVKSEPEILVGYEPAMGQTVGVTGQIKVWVNDESPAFIAPGEMVDNTTGAITAAGDRTKIASDGLPYEPGLYIAPQSPTIGSTPHFPQWIKGSYDNNPPSGALLTTPPPGAPIDPAPPGTSFPLRYSTEFVWDVSALQLSPGTYVAVLSIHDGDADRAFGCVTIVIAD